MKDNTNMKESTTLIGPIKVNGLTQKAVLDLEKLEPAVREKVEDLERQMYENAGNMARGALGIGRALVEIQALLEPMKLFTFYLNRAAWLPSSTAYRYMAAYKRLQGRLPEAVVEKAIASGMTLFGYSDKKPYGRYTRALEEMPAPPAEEREAEKWIYTLRLKAKELGQRPKREDRERIADVLTRAYLKDPRGTVKQWLLEFAPLVNARIKKAEAA